MKYLSFELQHYRAIEKPLIVDLENTSLVPLVGINECGKTTILQGIYCFDYINDNEYDGKHLKDTKNLYKTSDIDDAKVSAKISIKYSTFESIYKEYIESINASEENEDINAESIEESTKQKVNYLFPIDKRKYPGYINICRNLTKKKYLIEEFPLNDDFDESFHDNLASGIIAILPYILYNDDFVDRPPNFIEIPNEKPTTISGWLAIYERLCNSTDSGYSLFSIIEENDSRRRDAILSDIQDTLNNTLSKAWKTFSLPKLGEINVRLRILPNNDEKNKNSSNILEIKIIEKIGTKERFFDVVDRSKGFLWFFNFVMKLQFNPKISGNKADTIYLLDEPGSYLHSSAQEKLCQKLKDLSIKYGKVVYCTHCHNLLNPTIIPLNHIYIIEKNRAKNISAIPLPKMKSQVETTTAFQPIYDALQMSSGIFEQSNKPIIAVEGIYDKYAIELFIQFEIDVNILPGTSANSIIKNIQFLNGFRKKYVAIWDNDDEGRKSYKKAVNIYGEFEAKKFDLLPSNKGKNRKMEQMFLSADFFIIIKELNLDSSSSYERIISSLYFSSKDVKKKILKRISMTTKQNFEILKKIIEKRLRENIND